MAQVKVVAVQLVGGDGYMFARIEESIIRMDIKPMTARDRFQEYYWLHKPVFTPKSLTQITAY